MKLCFNLFLLLLPGCLFTIKVSAQQPSIPVDSGKVFQLKDLQELLLANHPIVKRATFLSAEARAKVLEAWGNFDPQLKASIDRKDFGGTQYYNYWYSELKVPIWLAGADLKVGYDRNVGTYINPDKRTGTDGLTSVGISVPIGQGLLIDARRNTLRQSRLMVGYAEAEQVKQINEIWFEAVQQYWNWYYTYLQYTLVRDGVRLAEQRFKGVAAQVFLGDKPPIDSIEASITVFERRIQFEKLRMDLQNARLLLSNHLWKENGDPAELPENALPQDGTKNIGSITENKLDSLVNAANTHPELLKLRTKAGQLAIERDYRRLQLQPKINVSGALISNRTGFSSDIPKYYDFQASNYKLGIDFALPLFLRSERGKLKQINIQQQQLKYDLEQTGRVIKNGVQTAYNTLKAYEAQLRVQSQSISNQQILVNGELQKFDLGESTLFLINSRETKLIEMRVKQAEMVADYQKKLAELYYKAGTRQNAGGQ